jgi:hypothetical protein
MQLSRDAHDSELQLTIVKNRSELTEIVSIQAWKLWKDGKTEDFLDSTVWHLISDQCQVTNAEFRATT